MVDNSSVGKLAGGLAPARSTFAGLFFVTLSTLMYEILLTRIFSVTMWYHFAFMAVSLALFGMSAGAIIVYLRPKYFGPERTSYHLALSSLFFALSIVPTFLVHLSIPFAIHLSFTGFFAIAFTFSVISVPFVFSGITVCLALTRFGTQVSRLYAIDLAGAAVGCVLLILTLSLTDGPTAVIVVALLAGIGAFLFARSASSRKLGQIAGTCLLILAAVAGLNSWQASNQASVLRLMWVKGELERSPLYEKWNSFSRIKIDGNPQGPPESPFGWGLSDTYPTERKVRQLHLNIDASAATFLTNFDGDLSKVDFLKYDVTNIAHYARPDSKVLVVGAGGGRDILSALAFDQRSVLALELNGEIINAVNQRYGDFTGHLDRNPKVRIVNDEARSYVARSQEEFDIIQVSLIDTWAATGAGAFVLSENSLYTKEAWQLFIDRLSPDGILSFSRWYFRDTPGEMYRVTALATASLQESGISEPRKHLMIVRHMMEKGEGPDGVGTLLVSKSPFSASTLNRVESVAKSMKFDIVLDPQFAIDDTFEKIADGKDLAAFTAGYPINIAPPTDDNPFFFNMLRIDRMFAEGINGQGLQTFNMGAVFILGSLLLTVLGLTFLCIVIPLILTTQKKQLKGSSSLIAFFACIGFGFMLIEIAQMQRLIVFLGQPTYALSVVLFSLLLSSGLGSLTTERMSCPFKRSALIRLALLLAVLAAIGSMTPYLAASFAGETTLVRAAIAIAILFPMGFFMGMAFPIGMKIATEKSAGLSPWLWGINGATSVCASVIATAVSLSASISTAFWAGLACYTFAIICFALTTRRRNLLG